MKHYQQLEKGYINIFPNSKTKVTAKDMVHRRPPIDRTTKTENRQRNSLTATNKIYMTA